MVRYCAGIDIGGTTVKCGIFTVEGVLTDKWEVPTRKEDGGRNILPDVAKSLVKKLKDNEITKDEMAGIGMGVPGPVQPDGYVDVCVNLGWKHVYPAKQLSELLGGGINCFVGNDANVAALGEMWMGGGKGYKNLVAVTLGTGVGGGIILDGHIVAGTRGLGGEIGHMHVREEEKESCNCGGKGCLEQVASATGIAREAVRNMKKSKKASTMRQFGDAITAKDVCDCAKAGDELAQETIETSMHYLAWALANVTMVVDPEVFVIGGGVSKAGQWLIDILNKDFVELTPLCRIRPVIELAKLGNDAGIYGAARQVLGENA